MSRSVWEGHLLSDFRMQRFAHRGTDCRVFVEQIGKEEENLRGTDSFGQAFDLGDVLPTLVGLLTPQGSF